MDTHTTEEKQVETLAVGTLIAGRYEIESLLGTGAMGCVYLAKDHVLGGEQVAVKVLHSEFAYSPTYAQRFLREVQLMRRLSHENIVRTYDVGADKDLVYFTMEFVQGKSLDKLIEDKHFTLDEITDLTLQICRGLEAIHAVNVIHRDLKPANVIITDSGVVKITDFGVARPEYSKLTNHNEIVGSAGYMAPEVWLGKKVTPAVDLYSLGIMLYEVATGTIPFDADSPGVLMRLHLDRQPVPLKNIKPELPLWLNKLVMRLLAKTPQERPRNAREILDYVSTNVQQPNVTAPTSTDGMRSAIDESSSLLARLEELSRNATEVPSLTDRGTKPPRPRDTNGSSATREILSTIIEFSRSSGTQVIERMSPLISRHIQSVASTLCILLIFICVASYWVSRFAGATSPLYLAVTQGVTVGGELAGVSPTHALRVILSVFLLYAVALSTPGALAVAAAGRVRAALKTIKISVPFIFAAQGLLFAAHVLQIESDKRTTELLVTKAIAVRNNITEIVLLNPSVTTSRSAGEPLVSPVYSDPMLLCAYLVVLTGLVWIVTRAIRRITGGRTMSVLSLSGLFVLLILGESAIVSTVNIPASRGILSLDLLSLHAVLSLPDFGWAIFNWLVAAGTVAYLVVQGILDRKNRDT